MGQAVTMGPMCQVDPYAPPINVADRLAEIAARMPETLAVVDEGRGARHEVRVNDATRVSFAKLDDNATAIARGLIEMGVTPGARLVLLVPPGVAMVTLVFGLLRSGATTVLIDPGMGRRHLIRCLAAVRPQGFVAISPAQAARCLLRHRFTQAKINVTVGRRWFWGGPTYEQLIAKGQQSQVSLPTTRVKEPAAIIYTSGSTGPPKGVLYTHQMFDTQASQIQQQYAIQPGAIDLACFALFGLFNSAMGVTTIFPDIDFSRPASADPQKLLAAANRWQITQAFASPAVWDKLSHYCEQHHQQIPSLRKVLSCGAPVPANVLQRTLACIHPSAEMHTPYGATECLPIATIGAHEVLDETAAQTNQGAGVCVGRKFACGEWRVIRITDSPINSIDQSERLPTGHVGELIFRGPQASPEYVCVEREVRSEERVDKRLGEDDPNALAKIRDGKEIWHRLGDVGYFDEQQRFWYCGRKAHRVKTGTGTLYSICCEAIFNQHPQVRRSALVGIGSPGAKTPILIVETVHDWPAAQQTSSRHMGSKSPAWQALIDQLQKMGREHEMTRGILKYLWHPSLPVDIRHNAKINREQLTEWAAEQPI
jgi:acyl-CoA synthetase (AMP-forming)/AMP-acid ligase II